MKNFAKPLAAVCLLACLLGLCACKSEDKPVSASNPSASSVGSSLPTADNTSENGTSSADGSGGTSSVGATSKTDKTYSASNALGGGKSDVSSTESSDPIIALSAERNGQTVTVTVNIKRNPGLSAYSLKLKYDDTVVTPVALKNGMTSVTSNLHQSADCKGTVTAVYVDAVGFSDDGVLFSVEFRLADGKNTADFELLAENNSFLDKSGSRFLTFKVSGASVK